MKVIMTFEQYRDFREYVRTGNTPFFIRRLDLADLPDEVKPELEILDITYSAERGVANVILKKDQNDPQVFGLGWGISVVADIDAKDVHQ